MRVFSFKACLQVCEKQSVTGLAEHNCPNMEKKNLIRFVESFIVLPLVSVTLPLGGLPPSNQPQMTFGPQVALFQKTNTEVAGLLALNQAVEPKTNINELRAEAINAYFTSRKAPLAGMDIARKMVEEAEKHELDWRLLPAIAQRESSGGINACKKVTFSAFGWGSCKINFESYEQSIEVIAKNLGGKNPKTKRYYEGKSTYEILRTYNPAHIVLKYPEQVMKIMDAIGPVDLGENPEDKEV